MEVTFHIKETAGEIIEELKSLLGLTIDGVSYSQYDEEPDRIYIEDDLFSGPGGVATVDIANENCISIKTAWSVFEYFITGNVCTYKGAYRGLLSQNLLPTITPLFEGNEQVFSSLTEGSVELTTYFEMKERFEAFKRKEGWVYPARSAHPDILLKFIEEYTRKTELEQSAHENNSELEQ